MRTGNHVAPAAIRDGAAIKARRPGLGILRGLLAIVLMIGANAGVS